MECLGLEEELGCHVGGECALRIRHKDGGSFMESLIWNLEERGPSVIDVGLRRGDVLHGVGVVVGLRGPADWNLLENNHTTIN